MHSSAGYVVFLENVNNKKIGQHAGVWKQVVEGSTCLICLCCGIDYLFNKYENALIS